MKKIMITGAIAAAFIVACKSSKNATAKETGPTDAQLAAIQERMPATTKADLSNGYAIYNNQCTKCHGVKNVSNYPEDKLKKVIDNMSNKAKLNDQEKDAVWKYALATNLAAKKQS